jgi:hypothetical protein
MVYEYAFPRGCYHPQFPRSYRRSPSPHTRRFKGASGLLFTCSLIHTELWNFLYKHYVFYMDAFRNSVQILDMLGMDVCQRVEVASLPENSAYNINHIRSIFPKLRVFRVWLNSRFSEGPDMEKTVQATSRFRNVEVVRSTYPWLPCKI